MTKKSYFKEIISRYAALIYLIISALIIIPLISYNVEIIDAVEDQEEIEMLENSKHIYSHGNFELTEFQFRNIHDSVLDILCNTPYLTYIHGSISSYCFIYEITFDNNNYSEKEVEYIHRRIKSIWDHNCEFNVYPLIFVLDINNLETVIYTYPE